MFVLLGDHGRLQQVLLGYHHTGEVLKHGLLHHGDVVAVRQAEGLKHVGEAEPPEDALWCKLY